MIINSNRDCLSQTVNYKSIDALMKPRCIDDLLISEEKKEKLNSMIESGNIMHMILYGPHGTGKTSCANLIADKNKFSVGILTRTNNLSQMKLVEWIENFIRTKSIYLDPKILIIDDAEFLGSKELSVLQTLIDEGANYCKFIFTSNSPSIFNSAVLSRVIPIDFHVLLKDMNLYQDTLLKQYQKRFSEIGIEFDSKVIQEKITTYFPDYRGIANAIDFELK